MDHERQPTLTEMQRLGQIGEAYLDVARRTKQSLQTMTVEMTSIHPGYFVTSGISESDLVMVSAYGNHLVGSFGVAQRTPESEMHSTPIPVPTLPEELHHLVDEYDGMDEIYPQEVPAARLEALVAAADIATDPTDLDLILEQMLADTRLLPSTGDVAALIGLGAIRMRKHLVGLAFRKDCASHGLALI